MIKKIIALVSGLFMTMGCASLSTSDGQKAAARIGVQYATLKVINGKADRADKVIEIVDSVISFANGETVPIDVLEEQVRTLIPWDKLDDADKQLVELLILQVRSELDARVGDGLVDPEKVAAAVEVLTWVRDAAAIAATPEE